MGAETRHAVTAAALLLLASGLAAMGGSGQRPEPPGIRLEGDGFFVLGSDYPVRIDRDAATAAWLRVEPTNEARMDPRVVRIRVDAGLVPGLHEAAFRIDVITARGREELWLPVALCVGGGCSEGVAHRPRGRVRLDDARADARTGLTPSGNLLLEIVDRERERRDVGEVRARTGDREPGDEPPPLPPVQPPAGPTPPPPGFSLVLPWMCLEYPCGSSTPADIADATKGLDAINALSYERYTIRDGAWRQHPVGDPGPWARGAGLALWPMLTGGNEPSPTAVQNMWRSRDTIGDLLLAEARVHGYAGYCLDVEGHADATTRGTFLSLVSYLADRLHAEERRLMVATATWSTIAPFDGLARSSADYVASMDPYTSLWRSYIPANYAALEPARLIWGFTWDKMPRDTQLAMWEWMQAAGYNAGVAGAAVWRTPLAPPHPGNDLDYYDALRRYYPARRP